MTSKVITLIPLVLIAAACNMNSPQMIEQQIKKKKEQVKKLNDEIAALEENNAMEAENEILYQVPVSTKEMIPERFDHYIEITGKLEAEEDAFISPEMNGQIETIHVKEGSEVSKGQLLVSLNTSLIESSIQEVKTGLELAKKLYEKQKDLWDQQIGSEMQYLEAKNAKEQAEARLATLETQLDMARIKAPFSGVVETIMMKEGEMAMPGMQLLQLISLNDLKLYGNISERYITSVRKGAQVSIRFPDLNDYTIKAPISRVGNTIDNGSRTFRVEVKIKNSSGNLKPNMYSVMRLNDFSADKAYVVPSIIIKQDIEGSYLYIADRENNKAVKRYISTGHSYEDQTMVTDGVADGEQVIIQGFAQVSDGVDIEIR